MQSQEIANANPNPNPELRHTHFVWGLQYIDQCILQRENIDYTNDTLGLIYEDTYYHLCDTQLSIVAIIDDSAVLLERISYTPYAEAKHYRASDLDGDGDFDTADLTALNANWGSLSVSATESTEHIA